MNISHFVRHTICLIFGLPACLSVAYFSTSSICFGKASSNDRTGASQWGCVREQRTTQVSEDPWIVGYRLTPPRGVRPLSREKVKGKEPNAPELWHLANTGSFKTPFPLLQKKFPLASTPCMYIYVSGKNERNTSSLSRSAHELTSITLRTPDLPSFHTQLQASLYTSRNLPLSWATCNCRTRFGHFVI